MADFLKKLIPSYRNLKKGRIKEPVTIPLPHPEEQPSEPEDVILVEPPQLASACAQSVGKQRDHNEDSLFTLTTLLVSDDTYIPFGLYIVADGMGGHQHGEIASSMAVRALSSYVIKKLYLPLCSLSNSQPEESMQEVLEEGVAEAHKAIIKQVPGGGTTLTAALILGEQMTLAHVGDSRAYAISFTEMTAEPLTRDHSLVNRLVELGQITPAEASTHPQRNVLYRALGQGEPFEPDINVAPLPFPGILMLCSDGLWGVVEQDTIIDIVASTPNLQLACQKLIDAANDAGGPDNITVVMVKKMG